MKPKNDDENENDEENRTPRGSKTAQRIPQHRHCLICYKAIPSKETLCSDECEEKYQAIERKRKNYMYIMYALFAFVILMVIFTL